MELNLQRIIPLCVVAFLEITLSIFGTRLEICAARKRCLLERSVEDCVPQVDCVGMHGHGQIL